MKILFCNISSVQIDVGSLFLSSGKEPSSALSTGEGVTNLKSYQVIIWNRKA